MSITVPTIKALSASLIAVVFALGLAACDGPAEEAGEEIDEAREQLEEAREEFKEEVQETREEFREGTQDMPATIQREGEETRQ